MRDYEAGIVRYFNMAGGYGFVELIEEAKYDNRDVHFHINARGSVEIDNYGPDINLNQGSASEPRLPKPGDRILFIRTYTKRGPTMTHWCFQDEMEAAVKQYEAMPLYRAMGRYAGREDLEIWSGKMYNGHALYGCSAEEIYYQRQAPDGTWESVESLPEEIWE